MKNKWIEFGRRTKSASGKTWIWEVLDLNGLTLGEVRWFGRWRKYAFYPHSYTVYEQDCLRRIADFCEEETKKLRKTWVKS